MTGMKFAVAAMMLAIAARGEAAVLFDQITGAVSATAETSQRFELRFSSFDSIVIDDFTLASDATITSVTARVFGFQSFQNFGLVQNYRVDIFSSPAEAGVAVGMVGDVFSQSFALGTITTSSTGSVSQLVTMPFTLDLAGGTYWLGVTARNNVGTNGQIGISASASGTGNGLQINRAGGFALPGNTRALEGNLFYRIEGSYAQPAVPEPASWAMLIAGFGLVGATARRRRLRPRVSAA